MHVLSVERTRFRTLLRALNQTMYLLITVVGLLASVRAFNLEPRLPLLKQGTKGSYFGYSVSEHQTVENGVTIESL